MPRTTPRPTGPHATAAKNTSSTPDPNQHAARSRGLHRRRRRRRLRPASEPRWWSSSPAREERRPTQFPAVTRCRADHHKRRPPRYVTAQTPALIEKRPQHRRVEAANPGYLGRSSFRCNPGFPFSASGASRPRVRGRRALSTRQHEAEVRDMRVASVPQSHIYVRHLSHPGGLDPVVRLPDPGPPMGARCPAGGGRR